FSEGERESIRRHVPWTALVRERRAGHHGQEIDLVPYVRRHRELFPACVDGRVEMRDMLVDFAPYLFRGRLAGFLTRLSATGLANVTSGGGQVPSFVVKGTMDE